ncbi:MAG: hypothetical protein Q9211_000081 [Gyalolechia sp. 1 TL-2023]
MASSNAYSSVWEFARIIPQGEEAENALDLVYDYPELTNHHRSFIRVERKQRPEDSGSTSSASKRNTSPTSEYWVGYYSLSLQDPAECKTTIGWLFGRGASKNPTDPSHGEDTRGVDLLLIRPKTKSYDVAPVHARIQFHIQSGVLMLFGLHTDKPVRYRAHDESQPILLTCGQGHVFYQKRNSFTVGRLHYELVFSDFDPEQYSEFLKTRNELLYGSAELWPHLQLSAVPRAQDVKRGAVITHGTIGYGRFGRVYPAVYARSGEPLAVKHHQPTSKHEMDAITQEAYIGKLFGVRVYLYYYAPVITGRQGAPGLLPLAKIWCEHDFNVPCDLVPQSVFTSSPLAFHDFSKLVWPRFGTSQIMELFRGPLQGLSALHSAGYMHRDVSAKNLILTSFQPLRAVLGDYGKAIKADTDRSASIGPAITRAPEVDGKNYYNNKIDVWSIGFILVTALLPDLFPQGSEPFTEWYNRVMLNLNNSITNQDDWSKGVANMIMGMLALDPAKRSSAAQALVDIPPSPVPFQ